MREKFKINCLHLKVKGQYTACEQLSRCSHRSVLVCEFWFSNYKASQFDYESQILLIICPLFVALISNRTRGHCQKRFSNCMYNGNALTLYDRQPRCLWLYFHCAVFVFLLTFSRQNYLVKKGFNVIAGKRSIRRFSGCLSLEGKSGKSYRYLCKPAISGAFEGSRKHTFWDWTQCWFWKLSRNIHVQYIKFKLPHMGSQCNIWCPLNKPKNFI